MTTAQTIFSQLGGNRFALMTGAKGFLSAPDALHFKLPSNFAKDGITNFTTWPGIKAQVVSKVYEKLVGGAIGIVREGLLLLR